MTMSHREVLAKPVKAFSIVEAPVIANIKTIMRPLKAPSIALVTQTIMAKAPTAKAIFPACGRPSGVGISQPTATKANIASRN